MLGDHAGGTNRVLKEREERGDEGGSREAAESGRK